MTDENRSHARAEYKAQTSIAIPRELLDRIQRLADSQLRTRNNMIELLLMEAVEEKDRYKTKGEK